LTSASRNRDENKTAPLFGLPLNWGTQLIVAVVGAVVFWWLNMKWTIGWSLPGPHSMAERLWRFIPPFLSITLSIFFLFWVVALFIKANILATPEDSGKSVELVPSKNRIPSVGKQLATFIFFTAVIGAGYGVCTSLAYVYFPSVAGRISAFVGILALVALFVTTPRIVRGKDYVEDPIYPSGAAGSLGARKYGPPKLYTHIAKWVPTAIFLLVFFWPSDSIRIELRLASLAAVLLWPLGVHRLKLWVYQQSRKGDFQRALHLNRTCAWIPGYGTSFEGLILFDAAKYLEALEFLKPLAFDAAGQPRPASLELYIYSLALINSGHAAEAEPLLECARRARPQQGSLDVALASCLLTQHKEAEKACLLIEKALGTTEVRVSDYGKKSDHASRIAHYAWALGASGRIGESKTQIEKARTAALNLKDPDKAGIEYFIGEAQESSGDFSNARVSYETALFLRSDGVTAESAHKGLERLKER
jgi:hypothetical protein